MPFANAMKLDHIEVNVRIFPDLEGVIAQLGKKTTVFHLPIPGVEGYDLGFKNTELESKFKATKF